MVSTIKYNKENPMPYLASDSRYDKMTYVRTGNSGLKLPQISLGWCYNFGGLDHLENGRAIARRAFDLGITHFDLANNYGPPPGSAEENFGTLFQQDFLPYRDELISSTKAGYDMWPGPYGEWGSRKSCGRWGRPVSFTSLPTTCSIAGWRMDCWMCSSKKGSAASSSRLSPRD